MIYAILSPPHRTCCDIVLTTLQARALELLCADHLRIM
jgi:hypothetical protein